MLEHPMGTSVWSHPTTRLLKRRRQRAIWGKKHKLKIVSLDQGPLVFLRGESICCISAEFLLPGSRSQPNQEGRDPAWMKSQGSQSPPKGPMVGAFTTNELTIFFVFNSCSYLNVYKAKKIIIIITAILDLQMTDLAFLSVHSLFMFQLFLPFGDIRTECLDAGTYSEAQWCPGRERRAYAGLHKWPSTGNLGYHEEPWPSHLLDYSVHHPWRAGTCKTSPRYSAILQPYKQQKWRCLRNPKCCHIFTKGI